MNHNTFCKNVNQPQYKSATLDEGQSKRWKVFKAISKAQNSKTTMQFIYSFLLVAFCWAGAQAADSQAQAKCRSLHHVDVDRDTEYQNSQCLLKCVIHGKSMLHNMNEGMACPLASSGVSNCNSKSTLIL